MYSPDLMDDTAAALNRIADALEGILGHLKEGGGGNRRPPSDGPPEEAGSMTMEEMIKTVDSFKCPHCSGPMALKKNRQQNNHFAGCTNYPDCKGTRSLDGKATGKPAPTPTGGYRGHPTGHSTFPPKALPRPMSGPPPVESDDLPFEDDDIPF